MEIDFINYPNNRYSLLAVDQTVTPTTTPSNTVTQTEMVTDTALVTGMDGSATQSPSVTSTITESAQPTAITTALPSNTNTSIPSLTSTQTPDYTNTPGPTNTLIPLPSITLLFPAETATSTQTETLIAGSSLETDTIDFPGDDETGRISAQSILLIGTIILLWAILAMFVIFYIRKMSE